VKFISIFHVDAERNAPESLRADVAFQVPQGYAIQKPLTSLVLPGGEYVRTSEPQENVQYPNSWRVLLKDWLPRSGQRPENIPTFEEYTAWPLPFENCNFHIYIGLELALDAPA